MNEYSVTRQDTDGGPKAWLVTKGKRVATFVSIEAADEFESNLREDLGMRYAFNRLVRMGEILNTKLDTSQGEADKLRIELEELYAIINQTRHRLLEKVREELRTIVTDPEIQGTWVETELVQVLNGLR